MSTAFPVYRFGEFRLDSATRKLSRSGEEVSLPPRVFDCLVHLIEHRERAIGRDELIAAVWGDAHLSDKVLDQTILRARRALDDTGQEQRLIETVRGFGYRWAAPVEVGEARVAAGARRRAAPFWILLTALGISALVGSTAYLRQETRADDSEIAFASMGEGDVALLLPLAVEADERFAWLRLGLMDLIAQRLRAAGQPVVPSETTIAMLRGRSGDPGSEALEDLATATGVRLVLGGDAEATGTRWRVSLRSLVGARPPVTVQAEAEDAIAAARTAADRMALALGRRPTPGEAPKPALANLLQRVEAATLTQRHDVARALIEAADPELREHPEVRFQRARIELSAYDLDAARTAFESLLPEVSAARNPVLRARILHCLGWVYISRTELDVADRVLEEAVRLLERAEDSSRLGLVRSSWGVAAMHRGDLHSARIRFAHARTALEDTGDALGLAGLDNHLGWLEAQRERYVQAVSHFEAAVEGAVVTNDLGSELGNLANVLYFRLALLDPQGAAAAERRMQALLEQTTSTDISTWVDLTRTYLRETDGRHRASQALLAEVLRDTEAREDLRMRHLEALVLRAQQALRRGDPTAAARDAAKVLEDVPPDYAPLVEQRGRAALLLVRTHLALGRPAAAANASASLSAWATGRKAPSAGIYAALAEAELAVARSRDEAVESAFERALALADASQVPLRLLQVAESYVAWLLAGGPGRPPDPERALVVAERLADYADRNFAAALLQLRATHAVEAQGAWRRALADARALAGEHRIPRQLEIPPT